MRRATALLMLAAFASCAKPTPQASAPRPNGAKFHKLDEGPPDDAADRLSIVSLARGASVVSRTGELLLENSAIRAIDGDPMSFWMGPPRDLPQSMVIALPARSRIDNVGIRTDELLPTKHIQVDRSLDGRTFTPLMTIESKAIADPQWFGVAAAEATHIRVTLVDRVADGREPRLRSFLARGAELEPPHSGNLGGCWSVNDTRARVERRNAAVSGVVAMRDTSMDLDGGFDGRTYRFNWVRGNDYGYAMFAVAPDAQTFSAIEWHEEAIPLFYGESWFGARQPCSAPLQIASDIRERYLRRTGRFSLFGVRFRDDGSIDRDASAESLAWLVKFAARTPVQLVAHEFRQANGVANQQFAQRELDALRAELRRAGVTNVTFVAKGSDAPRQQPINDTMRSIYSTVDVEIHR